MHHGIGAVHQSRQRIRIFGEVGNENLVAGRHDVDATHLVAGGREAVHEAAPDLPGRTGDDDAHSAESGRAAYGEGP